LKIFIIATLTLLTIARLNGQSLTTDKDVLSGENDNGFKEYQIHNGIEKFGDLAHVFKSHGASFAAGNDIEG